MLGELERLHRAEAREALKENNFKLYRDAWKIADAIEIRFQNMKRWLNNKKRGIYGN